MTLPIIRASYRRLIALYPREFRAQFGQSMEQTFHDLCRERVRNGRGVWSFALATFLETLAAALKERVQTMLTADIGRKLLVLTAIVGALLLIPLIAMRFTDEVDWSPLDFAVAATLLFSAGLAYILLTAKRHARRITVGVAIAAVLFVVWAELAVGVFGTPFAGS